MWHLTFTRYQFLFLVYFDSYFKCLNLSHTTCYCSIHYTVVVFIFIAVLSWLICLFLLKSVTSESWGFVNFWLKFHRPLVMFSIILRILGAAGLIRNMALFISFICPFRNLDLPTFLSLSFAFGETLVPQLLNSEAVKYYIWGFRELSSNLAIAWTFLWFAFQISYTFWFFIWQGRIAKRRANRILELTVMFLWRLVLSVFVERFWV